MQRAREDGKAVGEDADGGCFEEEGQSEEAGDGACGLVGGVRGGEDGLQDPGVDEGLRVDVVELFEAGGEDGGEEHVLD